MRIREGLREINCGRDRQLDLAFEIKMRSSLFPCTGHIVGFRIH